MQVFKKVAIYFVVIFLLTSSMFAAYRYKTGDRLLSAQTGSMVPFINPGDAVLVRSVSLQKLRVGDVISYRSPADGRVVVSHRLARVDYQTGRLVTKGDALVREDLPFPASRLIGVVYKVTPRLGAELDWLHSPIGLILAIYTPAAFVMVYEVKRLSKRYDHQHVYRHYSYR